MTVKEVVNNVIDFLQLDEARTALENNDIDNDELSLLVRCSNLVVSEIANEYYPLKDNAKVEANGNGEIFYHDFPRPPYDVYKVVNVNGISVPFIRYHDKIVVTRVGEYDIYYSYAPDTLALDDELPFPPKIDARTVAYGTACEYCLISGMTEEATIWDRRYKNALTSATFPSKELRIKKRRWI